MGRSNDSESYPLPGGSGFIVSVGYREIHATREARHGGKRDGIAVRIGCRKRDIKRALVVDHGLVDDGRQFGSVIVGDRAGKRVLPQFRVATGTAENQEVLSGILRAIDRRRQAARRIRREKQLKKWPRKGKLRLIELMNSGWVNLYDLETGEIAEAGPGGLAVDDWESELAPR